MQPGKGFGTHGHQDMEIISYVLSGALEHKDSIGTGSIIRPGDVQRMSAGTGFRHSEFNPSAAELVHFFQIWILPEVAGLVPGYEQIAFDDVDRRGVLKLVGSRDGRTGSITIHQDIDLYSSLLDAGQILIHRLAPGRKVWVQLAGGAVRVNDLVMKAGDGAAVADTAKISIIAEQSAQLILFDMA